MKGTGKGRLRTAALLCLCLAGGVAGTLLADALLHAGTHDGPGSSAVPLPAGPPAMGTPEWHALRLPAGSQAPDFSLPGLEGGRRVRLSSFLGHKPVVLIFGSFT
jgi:hypothetical protein